MSVSLVVIFGPQGSGKSLVASFLTERLRCEHLSWGALYRSAEFRQKHGEAFKIIDDESVTIGRRSRLISKLMADSISSIAANSDVKKIVLEGFPRRIEEARALLRIVRQQGHGIEAVVRINPSFESVRRRLTVRRVCGQCGQYYLDDKLKTCPKDGGELFQPGMSEGEAREELVIYSREIAGVVDHLSPVAEAFFDVGGDEDEDMMGYRVLTKLRDKVKSFTGTYMRQSSAVLETEFGKFLLVTFQSRVDYSCHLALVKGRVRNCDSVLVRVHSSCMTGDIFRSKKCDCGEQLAEALGRIQRAGRGVLVYLFQEGRGINIINKMRTYRFQAMGEDTQIANWHLHLPDDLREYSAARDVLRSLQVKSIVLLTNNRDKIQKMAELGVVIADVENIEVDPNPANERYLKAKKLRMGHRLEKV